MYRIDVDVAFVLFWLSSGAVFFLDSTLDYLPASLMASFNLHVLLCQVAHEIAHSWTGNLVTNVSWTHFWLNEGWTRWFELSIMAEIQGDDR
jgi:aminopeptidase N